MYTPTMDTTHFLADWRGTNPYDPFGDLMTDFGRAIGVPYLRREGPEWEPTKFFDADAFEPHLKRPVAMWSYYKVWCLVVEDEDGSRIGIPRENPPPGVLKIVLDSLYHRSIGRVSDAGFKSAEHRRLYGDKSVPEEWFFKARVETPERRAAWGSVLIDGGRLALDLALSRILDTGLHNCIKQGLLLKASLTGEEKFDRTAFLSILSDLQATRDTLSA